MLPAVKMPMVTVLWSQCCECSACEGGVVYVREGGVVAVISTVLKSLQRDCITFITKLELVFPFLVVYACLMLLAWPPI